VPRIGTLRYTIFATGPTGRQINSNS